MILETHVERLEGFRNPHVLKDLGLAVLVSDLFAFFMKLGEKR